MFEPLKDMLGHHSDKLYNLLCEIRSHLSEIADNTISAVEYEQFYTHGKMETVTGTTADITFNPKQGVSWRIERVGITGSKEGNCAVYLNAISPENLVDFISGGLFTDRPRYLVPRGSVLIFHFYEQTAGQQCTVNIQAEQFLPGNTPRKATRNVDNERIDIVNVPEVPSGRPLEEVQIGAR